MNDVKHRATGLADDRWSSCEVVAMLWFSVRRCDGQTFMRPSSGRFLNATPFFSSTSHAWYTSLVNCPQLTSAANRGKLEKISYDSNMPESALGFVVAAVVLDVGRRALIVVGGARESRISRLRNRKTLT
jgi:hypothetical protein